MKAVEELAAAVGASVAPGRRRAEGNGLRPSPAQGCRGPEAAAGAASRLEREGTQASAGRPPQRAIRLQGPGLDFCRRFFNWHNEEHCHWGIGLLMPAIVHAGQAEEAIASRAAVMAAAHARHPERFVRGLPQPLTPATEVWINPPENRPTGRTLELPRDTRIVLQVSQSH